ncbi:MAG: alpha/beta hydrolase, partial [bacterium]
MTRPMRDAFLELDGFRMHYLDGGTPEAPPLLMVHGLTREAHSFDPVFELLGGRYRCLAVDIRGRGQSGWTDAETYTMAQYADDVLAFLNALGLEQVAYLGTSMGGIVAMTIAGREPRRFARLALNDIGPEIAAAGSERIRAHLANIPERFPSYEAALNYEIDRYPWLAGRPREVVDAQYRHMIVREEDGGCRFHYDPGIRLGRAATPDSRRTLREVCWKGYRALTCPILLIRGAETDLLAPETVEDMKRHPQLTVVEVPGVGHAPSLVEPEAAAALSEFFPG